MTLVNDLFIAYLVITPLCLGFDESSLLAGSKSALELVDRASADRTETLMIVHPAGTESAPACLIMSCGVGGTYGNVAERVQRGNDVDLGGGFLHIDVEDVGDNGWRSLGLCAEVKTGVLLDHS